MILTRLDALVDGTEYTIVIGLAENCIGIAHGQIQHKGKKVASIRQLYVHENRRHNGHGRALIEYMCDLAKASGCNAVALDLKAGNDAQAFYEKCGFEAVYQYSDGDLIMRRAL